MIKAIKVEGITIVPRWDWSDWYYEQVKEMLQEQGKQIRIPRHDMNLKLQGET